MDYFYLCENGYEHMASLPTIDDCLDCIPFYMDNYNYTDYKIVRYKGYPGNEDAYAVLFFPSSAVLMDRNGKLAKFIESVEKGNEDLVRCDDIDDLFENLDI